MSNEVFFESNKTSIMLEGLLRQCESFDQFEQICSDDMLNSDCRTSIYLMRLLDKYGWKTSAASEAAEMSTGYLGLIINGKNATRDMLIRVAIAIGATAEETDYLLKYTADIVIEGFAHHLVAVADGKVIYDFPLVIQRIQFFILISGQPIIEPDFHNRSFLLWCADHARHTIAHNFLNSYQNKSGDFCFYFSNKISGLICIWMIHRQIVVDHHFQEIIELIVRTHIGIHDACDIGFLSLSTHSVPFSRNQFGQ